MAKNRSTHAIETARSDESEATEPLSFEAALKQLEHWLAALESGTLDLDASLAAYEKGVALLKQCHALLDSAEQQVKLVLGATENGSIQSTPFNAEDNQQDRTSR